MDRLRGRFCTAALMMACLVNLTTAASAQYETRAIFPVLPEPRSVALGDFNHDGMLDVAVGIWYSGQLGVLLGNGDGTFQPATYYTISNQVESVESVAVADFNGDGNLDIAVDSYLDGSVAVLLGNGDGTFQPAVNYSTPIGPYFVTVGDFNGDHVLDLVTLERTGECECISVLVGNGDGTFQEPAITTTLPHYSVAIGVGDFNRDGKLDIAAAWFVGTTSGVDILLGNGDGTFHLGATYPVVVGGLPVAVADLRGIGKLDLAIPAGNEGIGVVLGNGDGSFQPVTYYGSFTGFADSVVAADVSGDGIPDLVVSDSNSDPTTPGSVAILLGTGGGAFYLDREYPAGVVPVFPAVGDLNGDHQQDVVVANALGNTLITLLNTGVVSFSPTTPLAFSPQLLGTTSAALGVTLTNTGVTPLSIASMSVRSLPSSAGGAAPASQPFSLTSNCGKSVPAGGSCNVNVRFRPQVIGTQNAIISIVDSASSKPQVIELSGQGTVVKLVPAQLNFPPQKAGTTSHPMTVQMTNTSSQALHINSITRGGVDSSSFKEQNTCGSQLAAGASCTISVVFAPNQPGSYSAVVNISDNGGGTQFVSLSGTGT